MKNLNCATCTICHSEDDYNNPQHRRILLILKKTDTGYVWRTDTGIDCNTGTHKNVHAAKIAAMLAWGSKEWDLKATWRSGSK